MGGSLGQGRDQASLKLKASTYTGVFVQERVLGFACIYMISVQGQIQ